MWHGVVWCGAESMWCGAMLCLCLGGGGHVSVCVHWCGLILLEGKGKGKGGWCYGEALHVDLCAACSVRREDTEALLPDGGSRQALARGFVRAMGGCSGVTSGTLPLPLFPPWPLVPRMEQLCSLMQLELKRQQVELVGALGPAVVPA